MSTKHKEREVKVGLKTCRIKHRALEFESNGEFVSARRPWGREVTRGTYEIRMCAVESKGCPSSTYQAARTHTRTPRDLKAFPTYVRDSYAVSAIKHQILAQKPGSLFAGGGWGGQYTCELIHASVKSKTAEPRSGPHDDW